MIKELRQKSPRDYVESALNEGKKIMCIGEDALELGFEMFHKGHAVGLDDNYHTIHMQGAKK